MATNPPDYNSYSALGPGASQLGQFTRGATSDSAKTANGWKNSAEISPGTARLKPTCRKNSRTSKLSGKPCCRV